MLFDVVYQSMERAQQSAGGSHYVIFQSQTAYKLSTTLCLSLMQNVGNDKCSVNKFDVIWYMYNQPILFLEL